jgi:EAL domain-containing protein (putative c-di-GMP-specific phosphodiesterase class I)
VIEARYQPIVRIADRRPVALEALARLNHPGSGMVSPDQFVPQIEAAGLGAQFTDVIAAQALADLTRPPLVAQGFSLGLNFPLDVLLDPMALQRLDARRREAGIPAGRLIVELTESQPVEDIAALRNAIEGLRADGYQVWIDDVSPAVPRLRQLLQLPFSGMKFDKSLVPLLDRMPESGAFARRTVAAARAQGMTVVAEGVEDVATWRRVAELGVEQVQGFLIARPLPVAAVPVWLEAWARQPGFD